MLACLPVGVPALAQQTTRVSVTAAGAQVMGNSEAPDLSHTGRFVAFFSQAPGLVPEDVTSDEDVFVVDRYAGTIERVSVSTAGAEGNSDSVEPSISADGRVVAFKSFAGNLRIDIQAPTLRPPAAARHGPTPLNPLSFR